MRNGYADVKIRACAKRKAVSFILGMTANTRLSAFLRGTGGRFLLVLGADADPFQERLD